MDKKMIRLIVAAVAAVCILFLPLVTISAGPVSQSGSFFDIDFFGSFAGIMVLVAGLAIAASIYGALKDKQICLLGSAAGAVATLIAMISISSLMGDIPSGYGIEANIGFGIWGAIAACAVNVYLSIKED